MSHFENIASPLVSPVRAGGVDGPTGIPPKPQRPQSAKVSGKNATVTVPLVEGWGAAKNVGSATPGYATPQPVVATPQQPVYHSPRTFTPSRLSQSHQLEASGRSQGTPLYHQQQQPQMGGSSSELNKSSGRRPSSAQLRWSEKRPTVKTSIEVMKEVAGTIRESEAKALLQMATPGKTTTKQHNSQHHPNASNSNPLAGTSLASGCQHGGGTSSVRVPVCDLPGSGKFNAVFHMKRNLDLQLEAHRTLMNTRFSAEEERLAIPEQATTPTPFALRCSSTSNTEARGRPMSAKSRATEASARAPSTTAAAAASPHKPMRPTSAKSARSVMTTAMSLATSGNRSSCAADKSVDPARSAALQQEGNETNPNQPCTFKTVWHVETNDQLRNAAMQELSLGIHKEPFVPPSQRVLFRRSKAEAMHPFEDAELAAETASESRPPTPRSVLKFFKVGSTQRYEDVDQHHDAEWRSRVLAKIAEVNKRPQKMSQSSSPRTQRTASPRSHVVVDSRPQFVVRGQATTSRPNAAIHSGDPKRRPLMGNKSSSTGGQHQQQQQQQSAFPLSARQKQRAEQKAAMANMVNPKDVYAWNAQVVIPNTA